MPMYEDREKLTDQDLDLERARQSLVEELQAINWYQERIDATKDQALKNLLSHNRDEEKEHAAMLMLWISKMDLKQGEVFKVHD